jgi:hypothetical protein
MHNQHYKTTTLHMWLFEHIMLSCTNYVQMYLSYMDPEIKTKLLLQLK